MDYEMFTQAGNRAVDGIVLRSVSLFESFDDAHEWVLEELERLSNTKTYHEATDTEVREKVAERLRKKFPEPVFRSVRAKNH